MSHRSASRTLSPLLLILAVISLLAMPLDYRAGARSPHPHAAFQLLAEIAAGTLHHHPGLSPGPTAVNTVTGRTQPHSATISERGSTTGDAASWFATPSDDDLPRLTIASQTANLSLLPVASLVVALLWPRSLERTLDWFAPAPLQGIDPILDAPPPRVLAADRNV